VSSQIQIFGTVLSKFFQGFDWDLVLKWDPLTFEEMKERMGDPVEPIR